MCEGEDTGGEPTAVDAQREKMDNGADSERAQSKPAFKVVPNRGGFTPGVDPSNLKYIIPDLEDEEFLEKINQ